MSEDVMLSQRELNSFILAPNPELYEKRVRLG